MRIVPWKKLDFKQRECIAAFALFSFAVVAATVVSVFHCPLPTDSEKPLVFLQCSAYSIGSGAVFAWIVKILP